MFLEVLVVACLRAPVAGPITEVYAPVGRYGGHHGIDLQVAPGTEVRASGAGTVTFAGSVAGMQTITIRHGGDLRSTVSFLSDVAVKAGDTVAAGEVVGATGRAHDVLLALHFSVRVGDEYTDPLPYLRCGGGGPDHLYLLPPPSRPYARQRGNRPPGGNIRPSPYRPSPGGRGRLPPTGP